MRKRSRESFWLIALIFLAGAVMVGIAYNLTKLNTPEDTPRYVTYSRHDRGVKAMTRLLEANGYQVKPLNLTFKSLPDDADMLIVFPANVEALFFNRGRWTEEDTDWLYDWVSEGGLLMVLEGDDRLDELNPVYNVGNPVGARLTKPGDWKAKPTLPLPYLKGIKEVSGKDAGWRLEPQGDSWVPLLHDARGTIIALRELELGVIIESIDADLFTNKHLRDADNARLLLALVREQLAPNSVIYIDDAGQGDLREDKEGNFWRGVAAGGKLAFFHLMLLTAVVMFSVGKRFGLPRPSRIRMPAMGEYISAMAQLYQNAQAAQVALDVIVDEVRRKQCRRAGLPAGATLLQLIHALPQDLPLHDTLERAHRALQNPNLSEQDALQIAQSLTELRD